MSANELNITPVSVMPAQKPTEQNRPQAGYSWPVPQESKAPVINMEQIQKVTEVKKDESVDFIKENLEDIRAAIDHLNAAMEKIPTNLVFSVDDASKRFVVIVTDSLSGEVIRNVPGEATLRMAHQIESLKGVLFDDKY